MFEGCIPNTRIIIITIPDETSFRVECERDLKGREGSVSNLDLQPEILKEGGRGGLGPLTTFAMLWARNPRGSRVLGYFFGNANIFSRLE